MVHKPHVCPITPQELLEFCREAGYSCRLEPRGTLLIPPDHNVGLTDWERSLRLRCDRARPAPQQRPSARPSAAGPLSTGARAERATKGIRCQALLGRAGCVVAVGPAALTLTVPALLVLADARADRAGAARAQGRPVQRAGARPGRAHARARAVSGALDVRGAHQQRRRVHAARAGRPGGGQGAAGALPAARRVTLTLPCRARASASDQLEPAGRYPLSAELPGCALTALPVTRVRPHDAGSTTLRACLGHSRTPLPRRNQSTACCTAPSALRLLVSLSRVLPGLFRRNRGGMHRCDH